MKMFDVKEIQQHLWDIFILIDYVLTRQITETSIFLNKYHSKGGWELHTRVKSLKSHKTDG